MDRDAQKLASEADRKRHYNDITLSDEQHAAWYELGRERSFKAIKCRPDRIDALPDTA
jgi:hypothetical protein